MFYFTVPDSLHQIMANMALDKKNDGPKKNAVLLSAIDRTYFTVPDSCTNLWY
jgi:hypothetical protein